MHAKASEALEHVTYEMLMVHRLFEGCWKSQSIGFVYANPIDKSTLNNAIIETTCLHIRALLDFFESTRQKVVPLGLRGCKPDDIIGEDFDFPAAKITMPDKLRDRLNKEVSHLSYFRLDVVPEKKQWEFELIVPPLMERCRAFANSIICGKVVTIPEKSAKRMSMILAAGSDQAPETNYQTPPSGQVSVTYLNVPSPSDPGASTTYDT